MCIANKEMFIQNIFIYRFVYEEPLENTTIDEFEKLTRSGITLKYFEKSKI